MIFLNPLILENAVYPLIATVESLRPIVAINTRKRLRVNGAVILREVEVFNGIIIAVF